MSEIKINGIEYVTGTLSAREQLHVARKLAPFLAHVFPALLRLSQQERPAEEGDTVDLAPLIMDAAAIPIADVLCKMEEADVDYVVDKCLSVCQRKQKSNWAKVMINGQFAFADMKLKVLLELTAEVVKENLGDFFPTSQPGSATAE